MISIIRDNGICAQLWQRHARRWTLLSDWELRHRLATFYAVAPHFIVHDATGTVLPAGVHNEMLQFYGGLYYCERNGFIGSTGGERQIFEYLRATNTIFRLLSWQDDPQPFLPRDCVHWDVPFNQFWEIGERRSFKMHLSSLPKDISKEFAYLTRRYRPVLVASGELLKLIDSFIDHTIDSFTRRGAKCAYSDEKFREMTMQVATYWHQRDALRAFVLRVDNEDVGLGVFAEDKRKAEALFFLNLYKPTPSNISNCAALAVIEYACDRGLKLDGMRGAFALKPRYGYSPAPSYALVNDPNWEVRMQTDLPPAILRNLYGRPFGATSLR